MNTTSLRVLILGGYGTFGGRLARLICDEPGLTLIISGRSKDKADAFRKTLTGAGRIETAALDRDEELAPQFSRIAPAIVVDATGPFQTYGTAPYRVVEAALACGAHYIDLADSAEFVEGIVRFDAEARQRGVFVLSGASTCPLLTTAVIDRLATGMASLEAVTAGIAPSPHAQMGESVIAAIASYAGKPVEIGKGSRDTGAVALIDARHEVIAPPGALPLTSRRFTLVQVPDLKTLPTLFPELRSIWFGAGTLPDSLHRGLSLLAWLVRLRLLPSLSPLVPLLDRANKRLRWGAHRGGMFVRAEGAALDGSRLSRSWHLIAEGDDGPFIPSMGAAALIKRALAGRPPAHGARAALRDVSLTEYERMFGERRIVTGIREEVRSEQELTPYRTVLGLAWDAMPQPIRDIHGFTDTKTVHGTATIDGAANFFGRIVSRLMCFPRSASNIPATVRFTRRDGVETWIRDFSGKGFSSLQFAGAGKDRWHIVERFGPLAFALALVVDERKLRLVLRRWTMLGLPMPMVLAPRIEAFEHVVDGRFAFHVDIGLPMIGRLVRYRGTLGEIAASGHRLP